MSANKPRTLSKVGLIANHFFRRLPRQPPLSSGGKSFILSIST
jgi:hypothetical protein